MQKLLTHFRKEHKEQTVVEDADTNKEEDLKEEHRQLKKTLRD
jgi:hypothetical protein